VVVRPRLAGGCALAAAVIWAFAWFHGSLAHGTTTYNEENVVVGLTWMDSAKVIAPAVLLLIPGFIFLTRLAALAKRRVATVSGWVAVTSLVVMAAGAAMQTWPFPWGSYEKGFETIGGAATAGGVTQGAGTLVLTAAVLLLTIGLVRARFLPWWLAGVLIAGSLATFFLTPPNPVPIVSWLVLGGWLLAPGRREATGA
jgi:hypothetical protein